MDMYSKFWHTAKHLQSNFMYSGNKLYKPPSVA